MTASTPGTARAPGASTERIVPRAITDGTAHAYAAPSTGYSKAYLARPATLSGPSPGACKAVPAGPATLHRPTHPPGHEPAPARDAPASPVPASSHSIRTMT